MSSPQRGGTTVLPPTPPRARANAGHGRAAKGLRAAVAMALVAMMGLVGQGYVAPTALVQPAAAAGPVTSTNGGSYTVTSTVAPTSVPAGGGTVTVTYTLRNTSGGALWYSSDSNSLCATTVTGMTASTYYPGDHYLPAGGTATFTCSGTVAQTTDITASFAMQRPSGVIERATLTDTVTAGTTANACTVPWFSSFLTDASGQSYIGQVDPATGATTNDVVIPRRMSGFFWSPTMQTYLPGLITGSSGMAIDPTNPNLAYFSGRMHQAYGNIGGGTIPIYPNPTGSGYVYYVDPADGTVTNQTYAERNGIAPTYYGTTPTSSEDVFTDELYRMDLTTGTMYSVGHAQDAAFATNRMAIDGDGTLWTIALDGTLYSLPDVSALPGQDTAVGYVPTLLDAQTVDHGTPATAAGLDFATLTSGDIAFDGTGTLWVLASNGTNATTTNLITIGADQLAKTSGVVATMVGQMGVPGNVNGPGVYFNGLAFGPDGTLYASSVQDDANAPDYKTSGFYTIDKATGAPTLVGTSTTNGGTGDLGSCALPAPHLQITKTASPDSTLPGGTITYTITMTNDGGLPATGATFVDNAMTGGTYVAGSTKLNGTAVADAAGAMPYTASREVHGSTTSFAGVIPAGDSATITYQATTDAGQTEVCNQGEASYVSYPDGVLTDDPTKIGTADKTCVPVAQPAVQVVKKINGDDANTAPGVPVNAGSTMDVTFEVTNTGNTPLADVTVTDAATAPSVAVGTIVCAGVDATDDNVIAGLMPGRTVTCTGTAAAPAVGVQHTDTATVTGVPGREAADGTVTPIDGGTPVTDDDPANAHSNGLQIKKQVKDQAGAWQDADTAATAAVVAAGGTLDLQFVVTNPGLVPLTDVTVTDTATAPSVAATNIVCAPSANNVIATLAAGASTTCTATAAGPAAGTLHTDTGVAAATPAPIPVTPDNPTPVQPTPVVASNPANATPAPTPAFSVSKTTAQAPVVLKRGDTTAQVTYTVTVTNGGSGAGTFPDVVDTPAQPTGFTVSKVTVTPQGGTATTLASPYTIPGENLAAGATKTFQVVVDYAVDQARTLDWAALGTCTTGATPDATKGLYNAVTMAGDPVTSDNNACVPVTGTPGVRIVKKINGADADVAPGVAVTAGSTMAVTYELYNTGNVPLANVKVTDDKVVPGSFTCPATLPVMADPTQVAGTCIATLVAPAAGVQHTNVGTVTAEGPRPPATPTNPNPAPPTVTDTNPANAYVPAIQVVKKINGDDADAAPGVSVVAGSTMKVTFDVTNTGLVPLTNVRVTDDKVATSAITCPKNTLAPSETMQCTADLVAPAAGVQHTDVATVVGTPPANPDGTQPSDVTDTNPANAMPTAAPVSAVTIVKSINGDDANTAPGAAVVAASTMHITYLVTNTGQTALTNVTVTDDKVAAGAITCPAPAVGNVVATLAPGATVTCTATLTAPAAGVQHTNTGTVTAVPPANPDGSTPPALVSKDPANAYVPAIQVVKYINGDDADKAPGVVVAPGAPMAIRYHVTNTGKGLLAPVTLTDAVTSGGAAAPTDLSCPATQLAAGASMDCTATMAAPAAGVQHTDVATVTGQPANPDGSAYVPPVNPDGTPNTGTTPAPRVTDDNPANATLAQPSVDLVKLVNGDDANTAPGVVVPAGSKLAITFRVHNTGNQPLSNVTVTDDKVAASAITCPAPAAGNVIATLAVGQVVDCTATIAAPAAGGLHTDLGTVVGTPPTPPATPANPNPVPPTPVGDTDHGNATVPAIQVVKKINGDDANTAPGVQVAAGSTMAITYEVTNTGLVPLSGVAVTDKVTQGGGTAPAVTCPQATLAPGVTMTCTASMPAPKAGVQHADDATVVGTPPANPATPDNPKPAPPVPVTDHDPAHATTQSQPAAVTIVKKINGDDANTAPGVPVEAGSTMAITYLVTNTGKVALTDVTVTDDKVAAKAIECPKATLAVGESMTCTASLAAPKAGAQHTNTGTVTALPPAPADGSKPRPVTAHDPANAWTPSVRIVKAINGDDANTAPGVAVQPGSTMRITYLVTNTGKGDLAEVKVTDHKPVQGLKCPATTLAAGASMTCTATLVAPAAGRDHVDVGTVVGTPLLPPTSDGKRKPAPFTVGHHDAAHAHGITGAPGKHVDGPRPPRIHIAGTGSEVSPAALAAGLTLVAGGAGALVVARRRRDEE